MSDSEFWTYWILGTLLLLMVFDEFWYAFKRWLRELAAERRRAMKLPEVDQ